MTKELSPYLVLATSTNDKLHVAFLEDSAVQQYRLDQIQDSYVVSDQDNLNVMSISEKGVTVGPGIHSGALPYFMVRFTPQEDGIYKVNSELTSSMGGMEGFEDEPLEPYDIRLYKFSAIVGREGQVLDSYFDIELGNIAKNKNHLDAFVEEFLADNNIDAAPAGITYDPKNLSGLQLTDYNLSPVDR